MRNSEGRFLVKFRGIRGSFPTAVQDNLKYGGNTSCIEINVGGHLIILDAGTGIISLGEELASDYISSSINPNERKSISAVMLLSHIHQDHIQGLTFFKPIHIPTTTLKIFGYSDFDESLDEILSDLLFSKSFPLDLGDIAANCDINNLFDNDVLVLRGENSEPVLRIIKNDEDCFPQGEEVVISCYKSYAHPQNGVMAYKISYRDKSVVYATDREGYVGGDKKLALFARNCDLLIHDSQYTNEDYNSLSNPKQGFGHSTFEMALNLQALSHAKHLAFFHLEPSYNDFKIDTLENIYKQTSETCFVAKEGMEIEI